MRGPHGFGQTNDSGRKLFLYIRLRCVSPGLGRKAHKQIWQHPKSKHWSCIDYVVMRQRDRSLCLDVAARRGSECNTDHHLVCMKLRMRRTPSGRMNRGVKCRRFNVGKLSVRCDGVKSKEY